MLCRPIRLTRRELSGVRQESTMLDAFDHHCPYCGEPIEILVDASAGDQHYIEDCQVCCRPMMVSVRVDAEGDVQLRLSAENEA
jgi:hypothetical protein